MAPNEGESPSRSTAILLSSDRGCDARSRDSLSKEVCSNRAAMFMCAQQSLPLEMDSCSAPWFSQPRPKCSHVTGGCSDSGITSFLKRQAGAQTECIAAEGGKRTEPGLPRREPRWIDPSSSVFVPGCSASPIRHEKFSILRGSVASPMKNHRGGNSGTKGQSFPLMSKMKQNTQMGTVSVAWSRSGVPSPHLDN